MVGYTHLDLVFDIVGEFENCYENTWGLREEKLKLVVGMVVWNGCFPEVYIFCEMVKRQTTGIWQFEMDYTVHVSIIIVV